MKCWFAFTILCLLISASPADAGPVGAAIAAVSGWFASLGPVAAAFVRIGAGLLLSALSKALAPKQRAPERGIAAEVTLTGGDNSEHFILGRSATGGVFVAPPLSWPATGRRERLVYVIDLGAAGQEIRKVWIDGEGAPLNGGAATGFATMTLHGGFSGWAAYKILDGSQTAVDAFLNTNLAADPDFPWEADMIGKGRLSYVGQYFIPAGEQSVWTGLPSLRFEVDGLPLYDPRLDGTQPGGAGAHRWDDPSTWAHTDNNAVMVYNILRGITLPSGRVWGGGYGDADLPVAHWAAAMNVCDELVDGESGTEPRYRAGLPVRVAEDQPARVIEQLLAACSGDIADEGGTVYIQVGPPALPVYFFTDADLSANDAADLVPFPGRADTINTLSISHPEPAANYEMVDAPAIRDAAAITTDGLELPGSLTLEAVPYASQAQRLGLAYLQDNRRFIQHSLVLPPDAAFVPPLSTVSWTSESNGYTSKVFQVERKSVDLRTYMTGLALRERDPGDYDWSLSDLLPIYRPPNSVAIPAPYLLPTLTLFTLSKTGSSGSKIAGFKITGIPDGVPQIFYQIRVPGETEPFTSGSVVVAEDGSAEIYSGLIRGATHQLRFKAGPGQEYQWSSWYSESLELVQLGPQDIAPEAIDVSKLASEALDKTKLAAGLAFVEVVDALPSEDNFEGRTAVLTTDGKLYRYVGGVWTAQTAADDIVGKLVATQIAAGAIGADQLAANSARIRHLVIANDENLVLDATFRDPEYWDDQSGVSTTSGAWTEAGPTLSLTGAGASVVQARSTVFRVEGGEEFYYSLWGRVVSGAGSFVAQIDWLDINGSFLGSNFVSSASTARTKIEGSATAPAVATQARFVMVKGSNGATSVLVAAPYVRRKLGGSLIIDGSITAGMGLFSGPLQSLNFSSGSTGWQIAENGNAEFNQLIVRQSLVDGAVSDGARVTESAAKHVGNVGVAFQQSLGACTTDHLWRHYLYAEVRAAGTFDDPISGTDVEMRTKISFQRRVRNAGVWSAWQTLHSSLEYGTNTWQQYYIVFDYMGDHQDVELRGLVDHVPTGGSNLKTFQDNVRNLAYGGQAVVR